MGAAVRRDRYETIQSICHKMNESGASVMSGKTLPGEIGLAHYTENQIREYARAIGLTDIYYETIGKETEG